MNIETRIAIQEEAVHEAMMKGRFITWWLATRKLEKLHAEKVQPKVSMRERIRLWKNRRKVVVSDGHINVFFLIGNKRKTLLLDPSWSCGEIAYMFDLPTLGAWWSFGGRPLRMSVPLIDMGVHNNATIIITGRLLGGTDSPLPLYTIVQECEKEVTTMSRLTFEGKFDLQAHEFTDYYTSIITVLKNQTGKPQWVIEHLENFFQVVWWSRKCETAADYAALTALAFKLFTGKGVVSSALAVAQSELQSDFGTHVMAARNWFEMTNESINNPLVNKMRRVYTYLLVQGFLRQDKVEVDDDIFLQMDRKSLKYYKSKEGLIMTIIDVAITMAEKYEAYRVTGDWTAIIHDDHHYRQWSTKADKLVSLAPFTSNLTPHGTTYFSFIADLKDAIEKGEAILKYCKGVKVDCVAVKKKLQTLHLLQNTEVTRRASQRERPADRKSVV